MMLSSDDDDNCRCYFLCGLACLLLLGLPCLILTESLGHRPPLYSAAIDSFSGLDDADLALRPADLNPLFNLTLRVTTRSLFTSGCTHPGSVLEVTYAGVRLATGPVQRFCARPRKAKERAVVAWGTAVQVPGFALDMLAGDARRGVMVFDVAVTMPSTHDNDHHGKLVSCGGLLVGDAAALRAPCGVSDVDTVMSVPSCKEGGSG